MRTRSSPTRRVFAAAISGLLIVFGALSLALPASATDLPTWTYTARDFTRRSDPVSVVVYASLSAARQSLLAAGWHTTTCGYTEYIHYGGQWRAQNLMLEKNQQGWCGVFGTREHARIWELGPSLVVIAVHLDHTHWNGHRVHDFEGVEDAVANDFRATSYAVWDVVDDFHFLDNYVSYPHGSLTVYNDGYATEVRSLS